jgi:hypothetical protein
MATDDNKACRFAFRRYGNRFASLTDKISKSGLLVASALVLVFSLPALGQQGPESLLPEGFGDPAPAQTPVAGRTAPNGPVSPNNASASTASTVTEDAEATEEGEEEDPELVIRFDVPPAARQSLGAVGILSEASGGFPADSFGALNGAFLNQILTRTSGPIASRWGTIMARRLLASRTNTPNGVNGANWTAERAWLLLRMGDSVVARNLVQQVDSADYTKRLHEVAMQAYLANGDLAGMCPITESGVRLVNNGRWKMTRAICASLAGEQGNATALVNQGRYQGWVRGVDYLLAEKAVGAGMNGRRSVKIEWENVEGMNPWRFGLSAAVGLEPPESLFADTGRQVDGWRVQLPMFSPTIRVKYASNAAALGILSNRNMVDLYAQILDDPDSPDAARSQAESLGNAYTASDADAKVAAMASLWSTAAAGADYHASLVMTARAAALIVPDTDHRAEADQLVASMLTAGLDRSAARWIDIVADGSLGWALVTLAAPGRVTAADYGSLDDFFSNDDSSDGHKSRLLLAGLSGLGRIETDARADFASDLKVNISRQTPWSKAITAAAGRGEQGTVALMAVAALQAPSWSAVPANHLYYMVRSLRQVGLEAEARMIAAEAVTFA